uniref:Uncharacterized protein n=1 Tax=Arundo donax TaxID=35708 RepID=A0A0A8Z0A2_ARUDO
MQSFVSDFQLVDYAFVAKSRTLDLFLFRLLTHKRSPSHVPISPHGQQLRRTHNLA